MGLGLKAKRDKICPGRILETTGPIIMIRKQMKALGP